MGMQLNKTKEPMSAQAVEDLRKTRKLRGELGLYQITNGYKSCLRCNKNFLSQDIKAQRMCIDCRLKNY